MYRTLVSEIMLQQTTVSTVRNHFESFLHTFPTLKSLAKAHEDCVLIAWKGLGYYRRAVNLKKACEEIEEKHGGKIPRKFSELVSLAGIGDYTANALVSVGANLRGFPVDVNMARVLSRLYGIEEKSEVALRRQLKKKFHDRTILGQVQNYRETYEAIMDLGRIYCQAKRVDCTLCPVSPSCKAHRKGNPLSYGANKKRQTFYSLDLLRVVVLHGKGFLGEKREEGQWLSGQVEVPTFIIKSEDKNLTQYDALPPGMDIRKALTFKTSITKYRITNHVVVMSCARLRKVSPKHYESFITDASMENLSTATIKSLKKIHCL